MRAELAEYLLRLGDDALVAAQRLGEWYAAAPEMEEDVALANIALDQLGVARLLLTYAGEVEGAGRDEDDLAFLRDAAQFRNCLLVEQPNGDFAVTIAKLLFLAAYQLPLYDALAGSADGRLAGIAAKARKESAYHLDHAAQWTSRLGDGTEESHARMSAAVSALWPYTGELFDLDEPVRRLVDAKVAADPAALRESWLATMDSVLSAATIRQVAAPAVTGGRRGEHSEHLDELLGQMQSVHRAHPGAQW